MTEASNFWLHYCKWQDLSKEVVSYRSDVDISNALLQQFTKMLSMPQVQHENQGIHVFEFSFSTHVMITSYAIRELHTMCSMMYDHEFLLNRHLTQKVKVKKTTYIPKDLHGIHNKCSVPRPTSKERNSTCSITLLSIHTLASHMRPFLPPSHLVKGILEAWVCFSSPSTHHSPSPLYSNVTHLKCDSLSGL